MDMELKTERLLLREITDNDITDIVKQANNLNVSRYLERLPYPYDKSNGEWFINKCKKEREKVPRENYDLAIEFEGNLTGLIGLDDVNEFHGTGTLGYWLGEDYWRKGIMFEAGTEIIRFAFEDLDLRRIDVGAYTENNASNSLIKKLGFEYEGTRRQYGRTKSTGRIYDTNIYGLLKSDWERKADWERKYQYLNLLELIL
jgi:[ribosomal protein S5]-alanine N-acetyltransferase